MKKIIIRTERYIHHEVFYDIVYEWEDELCRALNTNLFYSQKTLIFGKNIDSYLFNRFNFNVEEIRLAGKIAFSFEMYGGIDKSLIHNSHTAMCVIDFYPCKEKLHSFYETHKSVPYLFISSKEVYDFLITNNPERQIYHLPLSLPDKYRIDENTKFNKKYDLVLVGRQNNILMEWLEKYCETHTISYVYRKTTEHNDNKFLYYTNKGEFVANVVTREDYFSLMRQSRIAFYSTPGFEDYQDGKTNGFSQVTPRFLELLSCGCQLIGRFPDNADTRFYNLKEFVSLVNSYGEFENIMNVMRNKQADMRRYSAYLENHYTSSVAKRIKETVYE